MRNNTSIFVYIVVKYARPLTSEGLTSTEFVRIIAEQYTQSLLMRKYYSRDYVIGTAVDRNLNC